MDIVQHRAVAWNVLLTHNAMTMQPLAMHLALELYSYCMYL